MSRRFVKQLANLHGHPPLTPAGVLLRFRVVVSVFASLAIAAAVDGGSLLLTWDERVT